MEALFWICALATVYTYALYPLALVLVHAFRALRANFHYLAGGVDRRTGEPRELPRVSVLVAAHDEEAVIAAKIENTLALDYPPDRLELLVGADGCADRTEEIVRGYAGERVRLSAQPRAGKAAVLNRLVDLARGDVLLFTDANTRIEPGALRKMVRHFPGAGLVCGRLRLHDARGASREESTYWKYENVVKFYESCFGLVMGANGALYAMPRALWRPLGPKTVVDDLVVAMRALAEGHRVRCDPEAVAHEDAAVDHALEFRRRARIAAGNFQALCAVPRLLSPRAGWAALALWSHKVFRWLVPLFLIGALLSSAALAEHDLYRWLLFAQLLFYGAAAAGALGMRGRLVSTARYFVAMNAALLVGMWRFLAGTQRVAWERTARRV